ncbi:hypothetical protein ADUPG1_003219, partial [Aduncisulcus paluster]
MDAEIINQNTFSVVSVITRSGDRCFCDPPVLCQFGASRSPQSNRKQHTGIPADISGFALYLQHGKRQTPIR